MKLPYDSIYLKSPNKKFRETIVFVHHFGGNTTTTRRHQEFVSALGFDCVAFNLKANTLPSLAKAVGLIARAARAGNLNANLQTVWANQLHDILEAVPGDKIIFSLSSPSACIPKEISDHRRADIKAWLCDGGPFMNTFASFFKFYKLKTKVPRWAAPLGAAWAYQLFGGLQYRSLMQHWLNGLPTRLPILSIRAGRDKLVSVTSIAAVFAMNPELNLEVFELEEAEHLEGLKSFPELYKKRVGRFLTDNACPA